MNKSLALAALAAIAHAGCPLMASSSSHGHSSPSHGHTSHGHTTTSSSSASYLNTSNDHPWMKTTSSHSHAPSHPAPVLSTPSYGHQTSHSYGHTTTTHAPAPAPAATHSHTSYQVPKVQSAFDLTKKALSPTVSTSTYSGAYGVPTAFDLTGGTMKSMMGSFSKFSKPAGKATSTLTHSHYTTPTTTHTSHGHTSHGHGHTDHKKTTYQ